MSSNSCYWWKEAVIYQIYPRSFKDSNGDGIGDLQGIISELDYLKDLGVDVLWLSPCFKSPNADNGYDVSDYQDIMDEFGTMQDFDELLKGVHSRGMKLILDLVVNHSSDEHFWFKESKKSKDNPYRDYYIWRDKPNDWISFFSGSAWEFDKNTQQYYLHLFDKKQPDLNWENPTLRQEIYNMMRFWLDKGVNGFRMDVIPFISKDVNFPNYPEGRKNDLTIYANGPRVHEFLQEMNKEVLSKYDCLTVGEGFGVEAEQANLYVGKEREELQMIYHFDHAVPRAENNFIKPEKELTLPELKKIFKRWNDAIADNGWQNIYFGNHDNPRILSRFGDTKKYRDESAKMLATVLLTHRGTPSLYQGDEIGMSNCFFENIDECEDVQVRNAWESLIEKQNLSEEDFLSAINQISRDHARTPMQWSNSPLAGFTKGEKPWLKVNANHKQINVQAQKQEPDSVLNYYKKLLAFRKQNPVLMYGEFEDLLPDNENIYMYTRTLEKEKLLVVNNFTNQELKTDFLTFYLPKSKLLSNYKENSNTTTNLRPYESRIYKM